MPSFAHAFRWFGVVAALAYNGNLAAQERQARPSSESRFAPKFDRRQLDTALASGDPAKWKPIFGDLKNPKYARDEVLRILTGLLASDDLSVRCAAAQSLAFLGAQEGFPVLQSMLAAASRGEHVPNELALYSAETLHQYRQQIDPGVLYQNYQRDGAREWIRIMTLEHVPQMKDLVLERRKKKQLGYSTETLAAYLGMADADSVAQYRSLLGAHPEAQLLAQWALYRATRDPEYLENLIKRAHEAMGLIPTANGASPMVAASSLHYLQITLAPQATSALRAIVTAATPNANISALNADRALAGLFYIHQDYGFVDQTVLDYFAHRKGQKISQDLIMRIAAARNSPELEVAAKNYRASAYEQYFVDLKDRPVESWIGEYMGDLPIDIVAPIKKR